MFFGRTRKQLFAFQKTFCSQKRDRLYPSSKSGKHFFGNESHNTFWFEGVVRPERAFWRGTVAAVTVTPKKGGVEWRKGSGCHAKRVFVTSHQDVSRFV